jgi:hypothetical protein
LVVEWGYANCVALLFASSPPARDNWQVILNEWSLNSSSAIFRRPPWRAEAKPAFERSLDPAKDFHFPDGFKRIYRIDNPTH